MRIAFWSPFHGTGATAGLLALAIAISEENKQKVLVTQTHHSMNNLERPLLGNVEQEEFFRDTGLDALIRYFRSNSVTMEQISNCSIRVTKYLHLLAGTKVANKESFENATVQQIVNKIMEIADKCFDMVFIDTNSGESAQSYDVIRDCDMVIVNLRQNRQMIEQFLDNEYFEGRKIFYLFSQYDADSKYNLANLRKLYKKINRENSAGIPHCTAYMDAICDDRVLDYILSNLDADEDASDYPFIRSIREAAEMVSDLATKREGKR